jgi:hypothetical protein
MSTVFPAAVLSMSCIVDLAAPQDGAVFVYEAPRQVFFERIDDIGAGGRVTHRMSVAGDPNSDPIDTRTDFSTLAGLIPVGNAMGDYSRTIEVPDGALAAVSALEPGEVVRFDVIVRARLRSGAYQSPAQITVRFEGCGVAETPAGRFDVQRFAVVSPGVAARGGAPELSEVRRVVDYAPALGWPVRHDYGEMGEAVLVRVD